MIQLYLLVLIIIFVVILVTFRENFENGKESEIINKLKKEHNITVNRWGQNMFLYASNTLYTDENNLSKVGIKLFWDMEPISYKEGLDVVIIITNVTDPTESTLILDITEKYETKNEVYSYDLNDPYIQERITYEINICCINNIANNPDGDTVHVSNTLKITAMSPVPHLESSGFNLQQSPLMDLLKNNTFDIYL